MSADLRVVVMGDGDGRQRAAEEFPVPAIPVEWGGVVRLGVLERARRRGSLPAEDIRFAIPALWAPRIAGVESDSGRGARLLCVNGGCDKSQRQGRSGAQDQGAKGPILSSHLRILRELIYSNQEYILSASVGTRRPARMTSLAYPSSRYEPSPLIDLHSKDERERLSPGALKAFFNIMDRWGVRDEDARQLLGGVTNGPFYEMKKEPDGRTLDADRLLRISYLVGIFKALNILHSEQLADEWVRLPNSQSHLSRRDAPRFHAARRCAGDADRTAAARRPPGRLLTKPRAIDGEPRARDGELPPVSLVRRYDTHRLVPSKYSEAGASVLARIADDEQHLAVNIRPRSRHQRPTARRERPAARDRRARAHFRHAVLSHRQRCVRACPPAGWPVQRSRARRLVHRRSS